MRINLKLILHLISGNKRRVIPKFKVEMNLIQNLSQLERTKKVLLYKINNEIPKQCDVRVTG